MPGFFVLRCGCPTDTDGDGHRCPYTFRYLDCSSGIVACSIPLRRRHRPVRRRSSRASAIIPVVHHVGSSAVVATVIRCCERAADERTGKKSAANTPAPATTAPTTTAPAATAPATNPSGILYRYRRCVLDRERTTGRSRRGDCVRRRSDSTHGRRDEYCYRL